MKKFNEINDKVTSGSHPSYWTESFPMQEFPSVQAEKSTEVLVIGGGIAGLTTAYLLAKSGKRIILVEDGNIGSGESGRTTAQITYALDDRYYELEKLFGTEKTKIIAESHNAAIDLVEQIVSDENIDCNFERVPGYLFLDPTDIAENLLKEFEAAKRAGLPVSVVENIPGLQTDYLHQGILFPNQGQFHITRYLDGLTDAIVRYGGEIYTSSRATKISEDGAEVNGFKISAEKIVVCTNSPINDRFTLHTSQYAYRSYVVAAKIPKNSLPKAMWWDTGNMESKWFEEPYHYVRIESYDENFDLLISGGEDHKTGQADKENFPEEHRYATLTEWTKKHFPHFNDIDYKWSGQVLEPLDGLAFLGKNPGDKNIYIISGDSGNGMTHCTIGAKLIHDLLLEIPNDWEEIYSPSRSSLKTATDYLGQAGSMAYRMAKDWIAGADIKDINELPSGQGAILADGLKKIAVYRDDCGEVHACSAVCPHLGGILQWNQDEKSFDCPLHGSRFTTDGTVINGPSFTDLEKINLSEKS